jgi:hypothetical protein
VGGVKKSSPRLQVSGYKSRTVSNGEINFQTSSKQSTTTQQSNTSLKMAFSFSKLLVAFLMVLLAVTLTAEAKPFTDGSTSGTIMAGWGGALGPGFAPNFANNAVYYPYAGYGFFRR